MKKRLLSVAFIVTFLIGTISFAKETEYTSEESVQTISAEDIGIKTKEKIDIEVELEDEDVDFEDEDTFVDDNVWNEEEEDVEEKEEPYVEAPDGMKEGYESNTFYYPNEHTECEYVHCVSYNEEDNSYTYEEWCTVCGEGTEYKITEKEFIELDVETDIEF